MTALSVRNSDFLEDTLLQQQFSLFKFKLLLTHLAHNSLDDNTRLLLDEVYGDFEGLYTDFSVFDKCLREGVDINPD